MILRLSPHVFVLVAVAVGAATAAPSCPQILEVAASVTTQNGTSYPCCKATDMACIATTVDCAVPYPVDTRCILAGGDIACGTTSLAGQPCGVFHGRAGPFGASLLPGGPSSPLDAAVLNASVLANWPALGYDDNSALCCTPGADGVCTFGENEEPGLCTTTQYSVLCAGDAFQGICSVFFAPPPQEGVEIGVYFVVNANGASGGSSTATVTGSASSTVGISTSSSIQSSGTQGADSSPDQHGSSLQVWTIVVIVVLTALLVFGAVGILLWCRRQRRRAASTGRPEHRVQPFFWPRQSRVITTLLTPAQATTARRKGTAMTAHPPAVREAAASTVTNAPPYTP